MVGDNVHYDLVIIADQVIDKLLAEHPAPGGLSTGLPARPLRGPVAPSVTRCPCGLPAELPHACSVERRERQSRRLTSEQRHIVEMVIDRLITHPHPYGGALGQVRDQLIDMGGSADSPARHTAERTPIS